MPGVRTACIVLLCTITMSVRAQTGTDVRGKTLKLKSKPVRIVSLSPAATELLFAIGAGNSVVADTTYCDYPAKAKQLPKIGDVNTSVEKVAAMVPDLVVAGQSANRRAIGDLERLHIPVFVIEADSFKSVIQSAVMLGNITGESVGSKTLIDRLSKSIHVTSPASAQVPREKVLWIVQLDPLIVVGGGNFMDDLITQAHGVNCAGKAGKGWITISPELVAAWNPTIILASESDHQSIFHRPGWQGVIAVTTKRVYALKGTSAVRPGPRLWDALQNLSKLLSGSR